MNWYIRVLKKYATFEGRASRSEYWYFTLIHTLIIGIFLGVLFFLASKEVNETILSTIYIILIIYSIITFLPQLGVLVRRLHDTDRSGWWYFIVLIPIIGIITLLIFLVFDSNQNKNQYGKNPKSNLLIKKESLEETPIDLENSSSLKREVTNLSDIEKNNSNENDVFQQRKLVAENSIYPEIELYGERIITIGRSNDNNIVIDNSYISGEHLSIDISTIYHENDIHIFISDNNSTNGTYIGGKKIYPGNPQELLEGQRLILGSEEVVYKLV